MVDSSHNALGQLRSGINSSGRPYEAPPREIIRRYVSESVKFELVDNHVRYLGDTMTLTRIERDVVRFFEAQRYASYDKLRSYLMAEKHGIKNIDAKVFKSFWIHKQGEAKAYIFSFVGELENIDPLDALRLRLVRLGETDANVLGKRRREQLSLRKFLFKNMKHSGCGICGRVFSVRALVVAHKYPRSGLSDAQRLEPNVVMPMCVFGCDNLYERGVIAVKDGIVVMNDQSDLEKSEVEYVKDLKGRKVEERWLKGGNTFSSIGVLTSVDN